jgi:Tetratricopeptide repeat
LSAYVELVRGRARELFGLDQPSADEHGDQRRVATVWSLSLERVHQQAPAAEALLSLCAFLASEIPRELPRERPQLLPEELAQAVSDPLVYTRMLGVVGGYSLATVTPTTVSVHRLVQAVIQARLGKEGERRWAEAAFGPDDEDVAKWRSNLGLVLQDLGDLEGARAQVERALAIGEAALGSEHPNVAIWRGHLNGVLQALQKAPPEGPATAI